MQKGFTLIEIIIAVVIVALLLGASSIALNRSVYNSKIDQVEVDLRVMVADINTYLSEYGSIELEAGKTWELHDFSEFINKLRMSSTFSDGTVKSSTTGGVYKYWIQTKTKKDAWGNPYMFCVQVSATDNTFIIGSGGANGICEFTDVTDYNTIDDIIAAVHANR